ncbi:MAG TPA: PAS domain S-box protein [Chloroflexi bacterium]|nr:PAS domain S-box protein [Chloroflexota bacterium]
MNVDLLNTFNTAAIALQQTAHSENAVFSTFQEQISALGMRGAIGTFDASGERITLHAIAMPRPLNQLLSGLENRLGVQREGYSFVWKEVDIYAQVIHSRQPVYIPDSNASIAQIIPQKAQPLAKGIMAALDGTPVIYAPLLMEGEARGALSIAGPDLTPDDLPTLQAFANHIAIALENARLFSALQESEERYHLLFEQSTVPMYYTTLEGQVLDCNAAFAKLLGYDSREEILDCQATEFYFKNADRKSFIAQLKGHGILNNLETRMRRKDGAPVWILEEVRLIEEKGAPARIQGTAIDITKRKQAEDALKESEERFRRLFEDSADAILLLEKNRFVDCNQAALKILELDSKEQLRNTHPADVSPKRQADGQLSTKKAEEMITLAWEENRYRFEWIHRRANGENFPVEVLLTPMVHQGKKMLHTVWRDITERKKLEEQLRQSQKMEALGQLAGGVAHDFNNMLTVIQGYSGLLLKNLDKNSPAHKDISQIQGAAEQAAMLTGQLLAFSRRQIMRPALININEQIAAMKIMLSRVIREDITLLTVLNKNLPPIKADQGQIKQVIMNLCVNARDAMPEGGKLVIKTKKVFVGQGELAGLKAGIYVLISVSDTGGGMDKQTQSRIFEPFFTTKEQGEGTGLGLATVYGIVEQSGGHLFVKSQPGQGSTFNVYLPAAQAFDPLLDTGQSLPAQPEGTETILLVEDEDIVRRLIARILHEAGYTVLEAANGKEALLLIQTQNAPIHLLLTDVVMPKMNGRELAKKFRLLYPLAGIIYISGYVDNENIHAEIEQGYAFLQKPVSHTAILRKIREVLDAPKGQVKSAR